MKNHGLCISVAGSEPNLAIAYFDFAFEGCEVEFEKMV